MATLTRADVPLPGWRHLIASLQDRVSLELLTPPVDVDAVAAELGAAVVEMARSQESGRSSESNGRYTIHVRKGDSLPRRRFTVAHEIGHVLLAHSGVPLSEQALTGRFEALCNRFAAHLLVPVEQLVGPHGSRPDTRLVFDVAYRSGVSIEAAFFALSYAFRWKAAIGAERWDRVDERWRLIAVRTTLGSDARAVRFAESGFELASGRSETFANCYLPVEVRGRLVRIAVVMRLVPGSRSWIADLAPATRFLRLGRSVPAARPAVDECGLGKFDQSQPVVAPVGWPTSFQELRCGETSWEVGKATVSRWHAARELGLV